MGDQSEGRRVTGADGESRIRVGQRDRAGRQKGGWTGDSHWEGFRWGSADHEGTQVNGSVHHYWLELTVGSIFPMGTPDPKPHC